MRSKHILSIPAIILAIAFSVMILNPGMSQAKSMTLKVSHQFAAGDVRDEMGRVFITDTDTYIKTEQTNGFVFLFFVFLKATTVTVS